MIVLRGVYSKELNFYDGEYGPELEGSLMTIKEYFECVEDHSLMDDDGYGHPVKENKKDTQLHIWPSEVANHIPVDATHIIWYNK